MLSWQASQMVVCESGWTFDHTPLFPVFLSPIRPAIQKDGNMEIWMSNPFCGNSEPQRAVMFTNRSFARRASSLKMKAECLVDATRC